MPMKETGIVALDHIFQIAEYLETDVRDLSEAANLPTRGPSANQTHGTGYRLQATSGRRAFDMVRTVTFSDPSGSVRICEQFGLFSWLSSGYVVDCVSSAMHALNNTANTFVNMQFGEFCRLALHMPWTYIMQNVFVGGFFEKTVGTRLPFYQTFVYCVHGRDDYFTCDMHSTISDASSKEYLKPFMFLPFTETTQSMDAKVKSHAGHVGVADASETNPIRKHYITTLSIRPAIPLSNEPRLSNDEWVVKIAQQKQYAQLLTNKRFITFYNQDMFTATIPARTVAALLDAMNATKHGLAEHNAKMKWVLDITNAITTIRTCTNNKGTSLLSQPNINDWPEMNMTEGGVKAKVREVVELLKDVMQSQ